MLSIRLQTIANLIEDCDVLLDVGSDHGLLPYALLSSGRIQHALITDINDLPLQGAQALFKERAYQDRAEFILSDGLDNVTSNFDAVVIAGMGHHTIISIIKKALHRLQQPHLQLLIQSNTKVQELRQALYDLGFTLVNERLIKDRGHYYVVLKYTYSTHQEILDATDILIGPILRKSSSELMQEYLAYLIQKEMHKIKGQNLTSTINYEILMTQIREIQSICHK